MSHSVMTYLAFPIYGGAHLAVWNGHFPSNLERILWITSALSIAVLPPLRDALKFPGNWVRKWVARKVALLGVLMSDVLIYQTATRFDSRTSIRNVMIIINWGLSNSHRVGDIFSQIGIVCWVLARAYLLVEAFASLRSLPLGSYSSVSWASYLPHF